MFELINKETEQVETIYATKDDQHGYPMFLVRRNSQWMWRSAKHYKPVNNNVTPEGRGLETFKEYLKRHIASCASE